MQKRKSGIHLSVEVVPRPHHSQALLPAVSRPGSAQAFRTSECNRVRRRGPKTVDIFHGRDRSNDPQVETSIYFELAFDQLSRSIINQLPDHASKVEEFIKRLPGVG